MNCRFVFRVNFVMGLLCSALVNARRFLVRNDADFKIRVQTLLHLLDKVIPYQTWALKRRF